MMNERTKTTTHAEQAAAIVAAGVASYNPTTHDVADLRDYRAAVEAAGRLVPVVGQRATYSIGSDSYAMVVVSVSKSGHKVGLRRSRPAFLQKVEDLKIEYAYRKESGLYGLGKCGFVDFGVGETHLDPGF